MSLPALLPIAGRLFAFYETGTEGVIWSIVFPGVPGYSNLVPLRQGDEVLLYGPDDQIAWSVKVNLEYQRERQSSSANPSYQKQAVKGFWVNGLESSLSPEIWSAPFFEAAPAVAWVACEPDDDRWALARALEAIATKPHQAWADLCRDVPVLAQAIARDLPWGWTYQCACMGWAADPSGTDPDSLAVTFQRLVALDRARRVLHVPGPESEVKTQMRLTSRWPYATPSVLADLVKWAGVSLSHDADKTRPLLVS